MSLFKKAIVLGLFGLCFWVGVNTNADSMSYLSSAQGLVGGRGLMIYDGSPLKQWPPVYSLLLSLPYLITDNWMMVSFCVSLLGLVGLMALGVDFWILVSLPVVFLYSSVISEVVFLPLVLWGCKTEKDWLRVVLGVVIVLTRFVGVAYIFGCVVWFVWKKRWGYVILSGLSLGTALIFKKYGGSYHPYSLILTDPYTLAGIVILVICLFHVKLDLKRLFVFFYSLITLYMLGVRSLGLIDFRIAIIPVVILMAGKRWMVWATGIYVLLILCFGGLHWNIPRRELKKSFKYDNSVFLYSPYVFSNMPDFVWSETGQKCYPRTLDKKFPRCVVYWVKDLNTKSFFPEGAIKIDSQPRIDTYIYE